MEKTKSSLYSIIGGSAFALSGILVLANVISSLVEFGVFALGASISLLTYFIVAFACFTKRRDIILPICFSLCAVLELFFLGGGGFVSLIGDLFSLLASASMAILCFGEFTEYIKGFYKKDTKKFWYVPALILAVGKIIGTQLDAVGIFKIIGYLFVAMWVAYPESLSKQVYSNQTENSGNGVDFDTENIVSRKVIKMSNSVTLIKTIDVPKEQIKRTTLAKSLYYDKIEIYTNRVVGYFEGQQTMTWYFKEYTGIDIVNANMNSQFAQIVFMTGMNSKNRVIGPDFSSAQNANAMNDTNRILFCSGMFSFGKTNEYALSVGAEIRTAFENYKNNEDVEAVGAGAFSAADELKKFKELLDSGIITQEEFDAKKKQLLGL